MSYDLLNHNLPTTTQALDCFFFFFSSEGIPLLLFFHMGAMGVGRVYHTQASCPLHPKHGSPSAHILASHLGHVHIAV